MYANNSLIAEMYGLKRFALKLTRSESDASDLVQSTILRAIEKKHLFEDGTNLFSWTSKIMYNIFVTNYRRKVKFEIQYDPQSYIENLSFDNTEDEKIELRELGEAMQLISDDHREILMMVCVKEMQYAEVSEALKIPVGTVRSRLSRAREALQAIVNTPSGHLSFVPSNASNGKPFAVAA